MKLVLVMPVYNEEKSIEIVINEWYEILESCLSGEFTILVIDDGSTDKTSKILNIISDRLNNVIYHKKINSGHGESCLVGYREAVKLNPEWILQIDSDYQCDPIYFEKFWSLRKSSSVIMGKRTKRLDGFYRLILTKLISVWLLAFTGKFCPDPNVPYRLIRSKILSQIIECMPSTHLLNSLLSYKIMDKTSITWVDIYFRKRIYGSSFHKFIPTILSILKLTKLLVAGNK
jgi:glycosyltransferase involved in cell wall biosynthesis